MSEHIPLSACIERHLYVVHARNFRMAVYQGNSLFLGVRTKFGDRFLFQEDHWDTGEPHGTVKPMRDLGEIAKHIEVSDESAALLALLQ